MILITGYMGSERVAAKCRARIAFALMLEVVEPIGIEPMT